MVNGSVSENSKTVHSGASARVFQGGKWGFASSPYKDESSLGALVAGAAKNALVLSKTVPGEILELPAYPSTVSSKGSSVAPVTSSEAQELLSYIDSEIEKRFDKLNSRTLQFVGIEEIVHLATSDGSVRDTVVDRNSLFFTFTAEGDGENFSLSKKFNGVFLVRSFLSSPEILLSELNSLYERLLAKACGVKAEPGVHTCILGPNLAGILAHEAIGHTVEADLVLAGSIAGDYMDCQVASPIVTLVDFASTCLGELCPAPVDMDEEGIAAEDVVVIKDGILRSYLHNRQSAVQFGVKPSGNGRAMHFNQEPLIRMRNTAILPGDNALADMISSVERGYYLMDYSNGQADVTGEFMFSVNQGYEIVNGQIGRAIHDTTVSGVAFDMLKTVSALSDTIEWTNAGCGKKYGMPVGMGGPAVKCRIRVGG